MPEPNVLELDVTLPLAGFDLAVRASLGPRVAVVGPSGAGKTSLVEAIAGLRRARGRIALGGIVLLDDEAGVDEPPERRRVGYVPQHGALLPHLSVRRNLAFARPTPRDEDVVELARSLEIEALLDRMPSNLSGGEVRRVAIGRALLARPRLLLVDEPTAGLDAVRARRTRACLRRVAAGGDVPILLVTHDEEEAAALAEEALVLERGRVAAAGPLGDVLRGRGGRGGRSGGAPPSNVVSGRVVATDPDGGTAEVRLDGDEAATTLAIPWTDDLQVGTDLVLAVGAEEVLVCVEEPRGLSARNVIEGAVDSVSSEGGAADVRVGRWTARLTRAAARDLDLAPGRRAWLVVKSHAWRVVAG